MSKHRFSSRESRRDFYSFILFICLVLLSVSICVRAYIVNPNTYIKVFSGQDYVTSLCDDTKQYATDMCSRYYISNELVNDAVVYDDVYNVNKAYITQALLPDDGDNFEITANAEKEFSTNIYNSYAKWYDADGISLTAKQKAGLRTFADQVADYTVKRAQLPFAGQLTQFVDVCTRILMILIVVSAILTLTFGIKLYTTGRTKYRSIRSLAIAFESAALVDFLLVIGVEFVKSTKNLVLYPSYLCEAIMSYVNRSQQIVGLAGMVLFAISLVLIGDVWYRKYN
ncbi:MAG: hypothetical protein ACI4IN_00205 [Eubacterium sp.]